MTNLFLKKGSQILKNCIISSILRRIKTEDIVFFEKSTANVGDVVIGRVMCDKNVENILETKEGRIARLFTGNLILGTLGERQSTRWIVGRVPINGIKTTNEPIVNMLCPSGILGILESVSIEYIDSSISIKLLGVAKDTKGKTINIKHYSIKQSGLIKKSKPLIFIVGTAAEVGKTTLALKLIRKYTNANIPVSYCKLCGTGAYGEILLSRDAGAITVMDFVDCGLPTTYRVHAYKILLVAKSIINNLNLDNNKVILCETGGDILGANVPIILGDKEIQRHIKSVILVASDSMSAYGGTMILKKKYNIIPTIISGPSTDTKTIAERTSKITKIPSYNANIETDLNEIYNRLFRKIFVKRIE